MILRIHRPEMGDILLSGRSIFSKEYDPTQFRLDVQPIFQNPYESFSSRKAVDTYLYNTAMRLGIAKGRREAEEIMDESLKSVGLSLGVVKGSTQRSFPAANCSGFPLPEPSLLGRNSLWLMSQFPPSMLL